MNVTPLLRAMTGADVGVVAALQSAAMPNPWSSGQFIDALRPGNVAYILEVDTVGLAAVGVLAIAADQCDLLTIAVDERYQRRGYGGLLLKALLQEGARRGATECFLEVMEGNEPAIGLYRRFGFQVVGVRRRYYQLADGARDAVVMRASCAAGQITA